MTPPAQTIPAMLDRAAATWPDAIAVEDAGRAWTFAELRHQGRAAAHRLVAAGIAPGDRVAVWAPNRAEWIVAALGIALCGGVLVPINTRYRAAEAGFILEDASCKLLFTVDGFLGLHFVQMLRRPELPTVRLDDGFDDWLAGAVPVALPRVGPDDLSDVLFTSGTTGRPKGVMTTHAQSTRAFWDWSGIGGLTEHDRYLVVAPFFHCFGYKAGWLACLMRGATVLPQAVFDVDAVARRMRDDRITVLPGPPALYQSLLDAGVTRADLGEPRLAITGASTIPVQLIVAMRETLGFDRVLTAYGLTEATGLATMCRHTDDPETIATTSGRAVPGVELKLVDVDGAEVPAGTPGHILLRGYNVMRGYLGRPEATAETVVDGWLHTGDIGVMDVDGNVAITDRLKDLFIVGGFNAYPAEIESLLRDHPYVRDVAVIGVPDPRLGEVGMAFVVARSPLTEAALIDWARGYMANFKVPRRVAFVDALPRNASGKVTKNALREAARG